MRSPLAIGLAAVLSVVVTILPGVRARGQEPASPTFRASADSVSVDVSVRRDGRPVTGLLAPDFELIDNGVAQAITELSYEKLPIDVTVALDVSASVSGPVLEQLRRAVRQLRDDLDARDRLKLLTFNMQTTRLVDFVPAKTPIDAQLESITASGSSSIFDVVSVALASPVAPDRRQLIMLFTDGKDSTSIVTPAVLIDMARLTSPTIAIFLGGKTTGVVFATEPTTPPAYRQLYDQLAAETGGVVAIVTGESRIQTMFQRVLADFRSSYVLHFAPRGVARDGPHTLAVRVNRPGTFEVRARAGYVWR
jgi:VWFA-related protein